MLVGIPSGLAQNVHRFSPFSASRKSRRYWDGVMPSDFLNTFVNTR